MNKKTTWILAPLAAVALSLSGCGDDSSDSADKASDDTATTAAGAFPVSYTHLTLPTNREV